MSQKIKIEFHDLPSFQPLKEKVWEVCRLLYDLEETTYYARLSTFKHFAVFWSGDKIIGFLSFFVDETVVNSKAAILMGIGHGGLLPEYRNQKLLPLATIQFLLKLILKNPLKRHFIWGMAITHLSYRMGMRGTKIQYPTPEGKCPPLYQELLNWVGSRYYPTSYSSSNFTAKISFAAIESSVIPTREELKDPMVANFIQRVPTALKPNNKVGAFSITPIGPNVFFWLKKFMLGVRDKRKRKQQSTI